MAVKGIIRNSTKVNFDRQDFANIFNAQVGAIDCVFDYADKFKLTITPDTGIIKVNIAPGVMSLQGHIITLDKNYLTTILTTSSGEYKTVWLIAEYVKDGNDDGDDFLGFRMIESDIYLNVNEKQVFKEIQDDITVTGTTYQKVMAKFIVNSTGVVKDSLINFIGLLPLPIVGPNIYPHKISDSLYRLSKNEYELRQSSNKPVTNFVHFMQVTTNIYKATMGLGGFRDRATTIDGKELYIGTDKSTVEDLVSNIFYKDVKFKIIGVKSPLVIDKVYTDLMTHMQVESLQVSNKQIRVNTTLQPTVLADSTATFIEINFDYEAVYRFKYDGVFEIRETR